MNGYLLDENVLRELGPRSKAKFRKWLASVDDSELRLSVVTLFEKRRAAKMKRRNPERATALLKAIANVERAYADRIMPSTPRSSRNGRGG